MHFWQAFVLLRLVSPPLMSLEPYGRWHATIYITAQQWYCFTDVDLVEWPLLQCCAFVSVTWWENYSTVWCPKSESIFVSTCLLKKIIISLSFWYASTRIILSLSWFEPNIVSLGEIDQELPLRKLNATSYCGRLCPSVKSIKSLTRMECHS